MKKRLMCGLGLSCLPVVGLVLAAAAPGAGQPKQGIPDQIAALSAQVRAMGQQIESLTQQTAAQAQQLAGLQTQVDGISNPAVPFVALVHCADGDTVAGALTQAALYTGPAEIVIYGMCREAVVLARSHTTLVAGTPGSGLNPGTGTGTVLEVVSASNVRINGLTLTGAGEGMSVSGSDVTLFSSSIVENTKQGIGVASGRIALQAGNVVSRNGYVGIIGWSDAVIGMDGVEITDNAGSGIRASTGSTVAVNNTHVAGNEGAGIELWFNSTLGIQWSTIEENAAGIVTFGMASVSLMGEVTIQANHGDGLNLHDISVATAWGGALLIQNNDGWGVFCHEAPAVAQLATFEFGTVTGNRLGDVKCPKPQ
jgi:hypothetical protein